MKSTSKKRTPSIVNLTVKRRYLTQREIERLMDCARKHGRYGHRDATMILVAYRHGLRASEVCDLQWQQIELSEGRLHVHRVKNGIPSVHPIRGDEMRALRKLRRDYPKDAYVFVSGSARPPRCHSRSTRTCFAMPVGSSSLTMATTRGRCSTTSGTRTFNTRSGTPKWRPTDSRTFGGTDDGESRIAPRIPRHVHEITRSRAMASCAASACAPSARPRCQPPSSAGSACAWEARAPGER
jgi:Phage integrase family